MQAPIKDAHRQQGPHLPPKSEWPTFTDADWASNRRHAFLKFKRLLLSMFTALDFVVGNAALPICELGVATPLYPYASWVLHVHLALQFSCIALYAPTNSQGKSLPSWIYMLKNKYNNIIIKQKWVGVGKSHPTLRIMSMA